MFVEKYSNSLRAGRNEFAFGGVWTGMIELVRAGLSGVCGRIGGVCAAGRE